MNGVESFCTKVRFAHSTPLEYYTNVNVDAFLSVHIVRVGYSEACVANGGTCAASAAEELERLSQSALTLLQQSLFVSRTAGGQVHSHSTSETDRDARDADAMRGPRSGRSASAAFAGDGFVAQLSTGAGEQNASANGGECSGNTPANGGNGARRPPHLQTHSMQNLPGASPTHAHGMSSSYAPPSSMPMSLGGGSGSGRDGCLLYSKLLLTLPALYALRREHVQALFCRQTDIDVDAVLGAALAASSNATSPV